MLSLHVVQGKGDSHFTPVCHFWRGGQFRSRALGVYLTSLINLRHTCHTCCPGVTITTGTSPTARGRICRLPSNVTSASSVGHLSNLLRLGEDDPQLSYFHKKCLKCRERK